MYRFIFLPFTANSGRGVYRGGTGGPEHQWKLAVNPIQTMEGHSKPVTLLPAPPPPRIQNAIYTSAIAYANAIDLTGSYQNVKK